MRLNRTWWIAIGVAGVLLTAACGDSVKNAGAARAPAVGAPTTTTVPSSTSTVATSAPPTSVKPKAPAPTTAKPAATPTTKPASVTPTTEKPTPVPPPVPPTSPPDTSVDQPDYALDPSWWMTVSPRHAPAGALVWVDGDGFVGDSWQDDGDLWLYGHGGGGQHDCDFVVRAAHDVDVDDAGRLTGSFVVPATGICSTGALVGTVGHWLDIAYPCAYCFIGIVNVSGPDTVPDDRPGTSCDSVGFSTGVSGAVYVDEVPCAEALSFLQEHAWTWGAQHGPNQVEVGGFSCNKIAMTSLPQSTYECTRTTQVIWFVSS